MNTFEKALKTLEELFSRDYQFALATSKDNIPSVRFVDTFYCNVSLCNKLYRFNGKAYNIGHPVKEENKEIRSKLIKVFEPWYFEHNNEDDENMCYIKVELDNGFFYKDGTGYKVNFASKKAEEFPFDFDIVMIE